MSSLTSMHHLLLLTIFLGVVYSMLRCDQVEKEQLHALPKRFYRVKPCHRLNTSIIARLTHASFTRCLSYAVEKRGLAFNFSPKKKQEEEDDDDFFFMNCEVLSCPNLDNLTSLVNDSRFDYYSLYGNTEGLLNGFCIPYNGIFHLHLEGGNYSMAGNTCMEAGSSLAHVVSESRTLGLGQILATRRSWRDATVPLSWDTVAYVGLHDQYQEGKFETVLGEPLECFRYRAWSPGHPRRNRKKGDCVIIDDDKTWRAVNCSMRLSFFCELKPKPPFYHEYKPFANASCSELTNRSE